MSTFAVQWILMKEVQYINPNLFSPQDAWGKLSLAEKSAMIEVGVANGLTKLSDIRKRYNSFAMGGEEDNVYVDTYNDSGIGSDGMTLDDYLQAKRDSVIAGALDKSRTRTMPENIDIQVPIDPDERNALSQTINSLEQQLAAINYVGNSYLGNSDQYGTEDYPYRSIYNPVPDYSYTDYANGTEDTKESSSYEDYVNWYKKTNISPIRLGIIRDNVENSLQETTGELSKGYKIENGFTCINTATNNYGPGHQVAGNVVFYEDPARYGFTEINMNDAEPGDLIQLKHKKGRPTHAVIFNGYDSNGEPTFNYSDGGFNEENYKVGAHWRGIFNEGPNNDNRAYRFIGNPQDIENWTQEYYDTHSLGGPLIQQANKR